MKFTSTVIVKQYNTTTLVNPCSACGHKDELDLTELAEEVAVPVEFHLPDRLLHRGDDGRADGSVETAGLLREVYN